MKNTAFNDLMLALPTVGQDAARTILAGHGCTSYPYDCGFGETITVTAPDPGPDPWDPHGTNDPYDPFNNPDPYDPYGNDPGGGSGGPGNGNGTPSYLYYTGGFGADVADGSAPASHSAGFYDKVNLAATALGITAGVQDLKATALTQLVESTTLSNATTVQNLTRYGKAWGIVGVAVGGTQLYYAFSDGNISNSDVIDAVSVGLGIVGLVASGPIGWIAGGVSLGLAVYNATN